MAAMIKYKLSRKPRIMFVGINPHYGSYRRGVPFSNNKMFWYLLNRSGVIGENMEDLRDDAKLRRIYEDRFVQVYNLNFTNLINRPSRDVSQLKRGEGIFGRKRIIGEITRCEPRVVCFVGRVTYAKFTGSDDFDFGWQRMILRSKVYVMHFPIRGEASVRVRELKEMSRAAGDVKR